MSTPSGVRPSGYLRVALERFGRFLRNDFAHLDRRVATIDGKVQVILALMAVLLGLMASVIVVVIMDGGK